MTLTIADSVAEDASEYEVRVVLGPGQDPIVQSTVVKVIVAGAVVLEQLSEVTVEEGETAKFSFKASKPCSVTWYKCAEDPKKNAKGLTERLLSDSKRFGLYFFEAYITFSRIQYFLESIFFDYDKRPFFSSSQKHTTPETS